MPSDHSSYPNGRAADAPLRMPSMMSILLSIIVAIPTAFAAPAFERPIDVHSIASPQPVLVAIPDAVQKREYHDCHEHDCQREIMLHGVCSIEREL